MSISSNNFKKLEGGLDFSVSAPGKVILHGEHSVVYGKLSVAASLGLRTKVHLLEIDRTDSFIVKFLPLDFEYEFNLSAIQKLLEKPIAISSNASEFNWEMPHLINHQSQLDSVSEQVEIFLKNEIYPVDSKIKTAICGLFYLFTCILSSADITLKSICLIIDSELSMGAGTGSSASISVTFAALLIRYLKLKTLEQENVSKNNYKRFTWDKRDTENDTRFSARELETISDWAFCGEKLFHGTPSGLDNTVCTYGNLVKFRKNHSTTHLTLTVPVRILLVNTNIPRETKKMVEHVAEVKTTFPHVVEHILDALEDLTVSALDAIKKIDSASSYGDVVTLEKGFDEWQILIQMNHSLLSSLGVSHQKIEEINMILARHKLTGKLTGAGGGGFVISVLPPSYDPEEVIRILKEHGFGVIATQLGGQGVRVD